MAKRVYLIRHGHTVWNGPPHRVQGQLESDLSEQGRDAAQVLGRQLRKPDRIVSSPAARCLQTVDALYGRDPDSIEERLVEIHLGWFCGLLATEVAARDPDAWSDWRHRPARTRPGGGETLEELQERAVAGLHAVLATGADEECVLVATHGGVLRTLICYDRDAPLDMYPDIAMDNLSLFRLDPGTFERGGVQMHRIQAEEMV